MLASVHRAAALVLSRSNRSRVAPVQHCRARRAEQETATATPALRRTAHLLVTDTDTPVQRRARAPSPSLNNPHISNAQPAQASASSSIRLVASLRTTWRRCTDVLHSRRRRLSSLPSNSTVLLPRQPSKSSAVRATTQVRMVRHTYRLRSNNMVLGVLRCTMRPHRSSSNSPSMHPRSSSRSMVRLLNSSIHSKDAHRRCISRQQRKAMDSRRQRARSSSAGRQ